MGKPCRFDHPHTVDRLDFGVACTARGQYCDRMPACNEPLGQRLDMIFNPTDDWRIILVDVDNVQRIPPCFGDYSMTCSRYMLRHTEAYYLLVKNITLSQEVFHRHAAACSAVRSLCVNPTLD